MWKIRRNNWQLQMIPSDDLSYTVNLFDSIWLNRLLRVSQWKVFIVDYRVCQADRKRIRWSDSDLIQIFVLVKDSLWLPLHSRCCRDSGRKPIISANHPEDRRRKEEKQRERPLYKNLKAFGSFSRTSRSFYGFMDLSISRLEGSCFSPRR